MGDESGFLAYRPGLREVGLQLEELGIRVVEKALVSAIPVLAKDHTCQRQEVA